MRWNKLKGVSNNNLTLAKAKNLFDSVNCPNSVKKTGKKRKAKYQEDKFNRYSPILKDLTEFLEQLSSLKFDKSLPLLIGYISTFKANVLEKDRKLNSPISKNKTKWGFVSQRSNKPVSLDNLLIDAEGHHVIRPNTFFVLHSLARHWLIIFYH